MSKPRSRRQAAARIGCSPGTLRNYELRGIGPKFTRLVGVCQYWLGDLDAWLAARTVGGEE